MNFPDASNSGVPAGTLLSPYEGPLIIAKADTTIDSKIVRSRLVIAANSVTLCRYRRMVSRSTGIGKELANRHDVSPGWKSKARTHTNKSARAPGLDELHPIPTGWAMSVRTRSCPREKPSGPLTVSLRLATRHFSENVANRDRPVAATATRRSSKI